MAAPVAAMAGIAAASAIAQAYNSERERGATRERLEAMRQDFERIVPPDLGVNVWDDPAVIQALPPSAFDMSAITPEALQLVGQYNPQAAEFIFNQAPELIVESEAAAEGRRAQLDALRRYADTAAMGYDPTLEAGLFEAQQQAGAMAQSRQASALQDAARRGTLGSGVEMAAALQGGASAADRMAMQAQQAALQQYRARQDALANQARLGGQVRESEMREAGRNADILNRFNEMSTSRYQNYLQDVANMQNRAQLTNLQAQQRASDANVQARNEAAMRNQEYRNRMLGQQRQEAVVERGNVQDMLGRKYDARQREFENQMDRTRGIHGLESQRIQYGRQDAADRNRMIQGLGDYGQAMVYSRKTQPELWEDENA